MSTRSQLVEQAQTWKLRADRLEQAIIDIRDKAAEVAKNGAEERDRNLGRQIILLCEKALAPLNPAFPATAMKLHLERGAARAATAAPDC